MKLKTNPNCRRCDLYRSATHVCIPGDGPTDADILFVGEAPGAIEDATGKPFQGKSGQLLREVLTNLGYLNYRITNIIRCRPPNNEKPIPLQIKSCLPYLETELYRVKPKAIVALGATASKTLKLGAKMEEIHGMIVEGEPLKMACYHPAFILRDPSRKEDFVSALRRLKTRLTEGKKSMIEIKWEIVTGENQKQFFQDLKKCREFSFDVETSSLHWFDSHQDIRCLGLSLDNGATWIIPLEIKDSPFPEAPDRARLMEKVFELLKGKFSVAQNGKFDNLWLWAKFNKRFHLSFDTMLAHHLINENRPHGLKQLARSWLGVPEYDLSKKEKISDPDPEKLFHYCALDCYYTLQLKSLFETELQKDQAIYRLFNQLVMPSARAMEKVERLGLFIRKDLYEKTYLETIEKITDLNYQLNKEAGIEINWNSNAQIAKHLYGTIKLPVLAYTAKGAPSTGEAALLDLKHPLVDMLKKYRELEKFRSTYLDGWKEFMVGSRLYLSTKLHGTVTGRWSSRLHQVPREGTIRNLISAPPGWIFVQGDYSQAELRVAGAIWDEKELVRCYQEDLDVHWKTLCEMIRHSGGDYLPIAIETARKLSGKTPRDINQAVDLLIQAGPEACTIINPIWKEGRKKAKGINFGLLYGQSAEGLRKYLKLKFGVELSKQEAIDSRDVFFQVYRQLPEGHRKQIRLAYLNESVRTLTGRTRHLPTINSQEKMTRAEAERQAINSPIQGLIGDWKAAAFAELVELQSPYLRVVGEVHDSILMEIRENQIQNLLPQVRKIMEEPTILKQLNVHLSIPLKVDLELGPWGLGDTYHNEEKTL